MSTSVKIMSVAKIYDGESNDMFIPKKAHESDAAYDVKSTIDIEIEPGCVSLIPAGFKIQLQSNYEAQIRPRSGNALKRSIMVANSPGTIDSGYRGEVGVILYNAGKKELQLHGSCSNFMVQGRYQDKPAGKGTMFLNERHCKTCA